MPIKSAYTHRKRRSYPNARKAVIQPYVLGISETELIGWGAVESYVGRCQHILRRWMAYEGFPKGVKFHRVFRWDKAEVARWMQAHAELFR